MIIYRINVLSFFDEILSDKSYYLDIEYNPTLIKSKGETDRFLSRENAYKIVNNYWEDTPLNNYLGYLIIPD